MPNADILGHAPSPILASNRFLLGLMGCGKEQNLENPATVNKDGILLAGTPTTTTVTVIGTTIVTNGAIPIGGVTQIAIGVKVALGSITQYDLYVDFANDPGGEWFPQQQLTLASSIGTLAQPIYRLTASGNYLISFPNNPAMLYMRIKTAVSAGSIGTDAMSVYVSRGWGNSYQILG